MANSGPDSNPSKVALVTGSSSGIGRAIAKRLAESNWTVILHGRSRSEKLLAAKAELETSGGQVEILAADFADPQTLEPFVQSAWKLAGRVDAWINNAGGDVLTGPWADRSFEQKLDYLLKVDVSATLLLSRLIGQKMKQAAASVNPSCHQSGFRQGHFSILNLGWDQAAQGMAGESGEMFATTKGAIMAMTRSLAQSLAPAVRVNCIAPGWIQTDWGREASAYWDQRARRESLMGRWGTPEDIADVAAFLCSREAGFISGQIIPVNGGFRYSSETGSQ